MGADLRNDASILGSLMHMLPLGCLPLNYFSSGSCEWAALRKGLNIDSLCRKFNRE